MTRPPSPRRLRHGSAAWRMHGLGPDASRLSLQMVTSEPDPSSWVRFESSDFSASSAAGSTRPRLVETKRRREPQRPGTQGEGLVHPAHVQVDDAQGEPASEARSDDPRVRRRRRLTRALARGGHSHGSLMHTVSAVLTMDGHGGSARRRGAMVARLSPGALSIGRDTSLVRGRLVRAAGDDVHRHHLLIWPAGGRGLRSGRGPDSLQPQPAGRRHDRLARCWCSRRQR